MNETFLKVIGGLCIFGGEALAIYQEMLAARAAKMSGFTWTIGFWLFAWMTFAGALLLLGYYLGYLSFKSIWVVTVLSIGAILISEPLLILFLFNEVPTIGAWVGLVFAVLGMIAALFF